MKKIFCMFVFVLMIMGLMSGCVTNSQIDHSINMTPRKISMSQSTAEEVVRAVSAASVAIKASNVRAESIGSGVAVASNGYILTNQHVIDGATNITLYFANGDAGSASVVWSDASQDLAILKTNKNIPYVEMSASTNLNKGQTILAIGTPLGLQFEQTVTQGIVSSLNRTITIENSKGQTSYMQNLIQHDASINPGNSGGPLFNLRGQVVGINTLKASEAEGLGFAIPIEVCVPILNKVTNGLSFETPYLGFFGFDATTASFYNKTNLKDGVYVMNVTQSGPCFKAGLKEGDVITKIGDKEVSTLLDLRKNLYEYQTGDTFSLEIERNSIVQTIYVTLEG